ncbi:MAG: methyltransferase [Bacteroidia bacterium]
MEQIIKRRKIKSPVRTIERTLLNTFYRPFIQWYTGRETRYRYREINATVLPGVFHPRFFYSTRFLLDFLDFVNFSKKKVLELGAGSGLISVYAAGEGAHVTATDINPTALQNIALNVKQHVSLFEKSGGSVLIQPSDVFASLPVQKFDIILVNPPFYNGRAKNNAERAWYSGESFDFFRKLFSGCADYVQASTDFFMILSDDCDLQKIDQLAKEHGWNMSAVSSKSFLVESLYIFRLSR